MIEIANWSIVGIALVGVTVRRATSRRQMHRCAAPTVLFADLAGHTSLTEELGEPAAAKVGRELRGTMSARSREHGPRTVESMGNGVMFCAPGAGQAIALGG